ncbi:MAG: tRNA (adenosine(37)-N6)-dimethylallyltransferase MiaA [Chlorobiaceae bacterium]|nr:tRNA (adenosine(37)-N6)-dimethylallyltransferase MiaA [Chlorobiaceae bacterium]
MASDPAYPPVLVIVGPTASGKSKLAFELARRTGGEIVSADSRQIYRELDIGAAKPSSIELHEVPHHFIDEKNIGETFTAGQFALEAPKRIMEILGRGKPAIVAGGSTLYIQGLLEGFAELPEGDPVVRARLQDELERFGKEYLYEKLLELDPGQAATLDPSKTQRLMRSLEIIEITGLTVTELRSRGNKRQDGVRFVTLGLATPRSQLYDRINLRTMRMIESGLPEEAERLYSKYHHLIAGRKSQALRSVGYQELFACFEGRSGLTEAIELIKQHTRNYAKRQITFFSNTLAIDWTAAPENEDDFRILVERLVRECLFIHSSGM